ncbi:class I adenylate-forming enzyme family protein [Actinosynnema sp. NPDC047251]|uniref:AMP-binding enzyme n=1 Tax=Saccharothrix espanaensis (strain ATCC 51144 / DSM 44229 / JCM 9112 / NBRC 15066 / NRRL 15764) TaxID=1179773 RepID=K0JQ79_SACES|nr:class I adenylate-forming enzyme family protein [Saccharothrix espanaensis]CCH29460.1 AMP-binding enzyme [Saccharothrix espanaensis DSM 44229]
MTPGRDFEAWLDAALSDPDRRRLTWATHGETVVTRDALRTEVDRAGRVLGASSITRGSTVAVQLLPSFTLLWSLFALWSRGAQVMLLDPRLTPTETTRLLELCRPQFHLTTGGVARTFTPFRDQCEVLVRPMRSGAPAQGDHRLIQFSSGSTGLPKVIGRTGGSLLTEVERFARLSDMPRLGENVLLLSSLAHSFGLIGGVLHALNAGAALHFAGRPNRGALLSVLAGRRIAAVLGVPAHYALLGRPGDVEPLPDLRLAVSGGEALPPEVFARFEELFGVRIGQAYGMTETGIIATDLTGRHGPPAVGVPVPGLCTEVVDGTLRVRLAETPYLHVDADDRYVDGWLHTRDRCVRRPGTNVLEITGRTDSLVSIGGLKVDLMEVEAVLAEHPDVREVVVVYGEAVEAHLVIAPSLARSELLAWCHERLSTYKIPKAFHFRTALPRTSNGKPVRNRDLLHASGYTARSVVHSEVGQSA